MKKDSYKQRNNSKKEHFKQLIAKPDKLKPRIDNSRRKSNRITMKFDKD